MRLPIFVILLFCVKSNSNLRETQRDSEYDLLHANLYFNLLRKNEDAWFCKVSKIGSFK